MVMIGGWFTLLFNHMSGFTQKQVVFSRGNERIDPWVAQNLVANQEFSSAVARVGQHHWFEPHDLDPEQAVCRTFMYVSSFYWLHAFFLIWYILM